MKKSGTLLTMKANTIPNDKAYQETSYYYFGEILQKDATVWLVSFLHFWIWLLMIPTSIVFLRTMEA